MYKKMKEQKEVWMPVKGYEGLYEVSNLGRVKSLSRIVKHSRGGDKLIIERILKNYITNQGYINVALHIKGKQSSFLVHQLVGMSFLDYELKDKKTVVHHVNEIRCDNRLVNLKVITHRLNVSLGKKKGTSNYIGVYKSKKKWRSSVQFKGSTIRLGTFDTELEASNAYKKFLESYGYAQSENYINKLKEI